VNKLAEAEAEAAGEGVREEASDGVALGNAVAEAEFKLLGVALLEPVAVASRVERPDGGPLVEGETECDAETSADCVPPGALGDADAHKLAATDVDVETEAEA